MIQLQLDFSGDYKARFDEEVSKIEEVNKELSRQQRMDIVEELTDAYIDQTGERPDGYSLFRLTNVVLHDELSDPRPDKVTLDNYPIMSKRQLEKRTEGKTRKRNSNGTITIEVPLSHATNVATDGSNHSLPRRSFTDPF